MLTTLGLNIWNGKLEDYVTILFGMIGESAHHRSELFAVLKMLCELGAVDIFTSSPLNVHWTFRWGRGLGRVEIWTLVLGI